MTQDGQFELAERLCLQDDLSGYDPYDIWKTKLGLRTKNLFNCHRHLGIVPAGMLSLFDLYLNNRPRLFYCKQEYPIVRALASLTLLKLYESNRQDRYLHGVRTHLNWLVRNGCKGYRGLGWGLGFAWPVSCGLYYDANTPLATATPYALEAMVEYSRLTGSDEFVASIARVYDFFESDIQVIRDSEDCLITSYGPTADRVVTNAVSYAMYSYCLLLPYVSVIDQAKVQGKITRLYNFVASQQGRDGSWLYSPEGKSFIDCFHSCIVIKNLIKSRAIVALPGVDDIIEKGYRYILDNMRDPARGLFKRFSRTNKPSLAQFDLYDNAEVLNLSQLMGDRDLAKSLRMAIQSNFHKGSDIYSQIDIFGMRQNKNMLRWAVMPYIYALSQCQEDGL